MTPIEHIFTAIGGILLTLGGIIAVLGLCAWYANRKEQTNGNRSR